MNERKVTYYYQGKLNIKKTAQSHVKFYGKLLAYNLKRKIDEEVSSRIIAKAIQP